MRRRAGSLRILLWAGLAGGCLLASAGAPGEAAEAAEAMVAVAQGLPAGRELTFDEAMRRALEGGPALRPAELEREALAGALQQARLLPNPELEAEHEGFGGSGEFAGQRGAESALWLKQSLALGGKRARRVDLAGARAGVAERDGETLRHEVRAEAAEAFVETLAMQERLRVAAELTRLASETWTAVAAAVEAGKSAALDAERMRVEWARARMDQVAVADELEAARRRLASTWGGSPDFAAVAGDLNERHALPDLESLLEQVDGAPVARLWDARQSESEAELALARAERFPDIELAAGLKYEQEPDDYGFRIGVALPLPLFDRNQGAIREAAARREQSAAEARHAVLTVRRDLATAFLAMRTARDRADGLETEVAPSAERLYAAARESFQLGRAGYLDVLEAQRSLVLARLDHLEALEAYQHARLRVEQLTGSVFPAVNGGDRHE